MAGHGLRPLVWAHLKPLPQKFKHTLIRYLVLLCAEPHPVLSLLPRLTSLCSLHVDHRGWRPFKHPDSSMHSSTIAALSALTGLTELHVNMGRSRNMPAWAEALSAMGKLQELGVEMHPLSLAAMEAVGHAANVQRLRITCSTQIGEEAPVLTAAQVRSFVKASKVELHSEKLDDCLPYRALLGHPSVIKLVENYGYLKWECVGGWSLDECACWGCIRRDSTGQRMSLRHF